MDETQAQGPLGMVLRARLLARSRQYALHGAGLLASPIRPAFFVRIKFRLFGRGGYCAHGQASRRLVVQRLVPDFVRVRYEKESGFVFGFLD